MNAKRRPPFLHSRVGFGHAIHLFNDWLHEGWCVQGDEGTMDRRYLVRYNLTANIVANLIGGNFYTGFLILLGADDGFIGLMTILVYAANLFQLVSPLILERLSKRKPLLVALRIAYHLLNIVFIGLIPLVSGVTQIRMTLLAVTVLAVNIINSLMSPGLSVWHIAHIPPRVRVSYFSIVSIVNGIGVAVCNLCASALVDVFKASNFELYGLLAIRVVAVMVAIYDVTLLIRIRDVPVTKSLKVHVLDILTKPWREKRYLRTVLIAFLWNLSANLVGSYYTVHLLRNVQVSYSFITIISLLNIPILLLFTPIWRRVYANSSWMKPLSLALLIYAPRFLIESFVTKDLLFLFPLGEIWCYICMVGINLGFSSFAYINIPEKNQTIYIGFYSTICNLGALLGSTFGRSFVTTLAGFQMTIFGVGIGEKQMLMAVSGIAMVIMSFVTYWVWRKNSAEGAET